VFECHWYVSGDSPTHGFAKWTERRASALEKWPISGQTLANLQKALGQRGTELEQVEAQIRETEAQIRQTQHELERVQQSNERLRAQLRAMGIEPLA